MVARGAVEEAVLSERDAAINAEVTARVAALLADAIARISAGESLDLAAYASEHTGEIRSAAKPVRVSSAVRLTPEEKAANKAAKAVAQARMLEPVTALLGRIVSEFAHSAEVIALAKSLNIYGLKVDGKGGFTAGAIKLSKGTSRPRQAKSNSKLLGDVYPNRFVPTGVKVEYQGKVATKVAQGWMTEGDDTVYDPLNKLSSAFGFKVNVWQSWRVIE